jgi:hypothetical protein
VFASFIFFYRSEHQLRKIGLMKAVTPPRAASTSNTPAKLLSPAEFPLASSPGEEVIPKGPELFKDPPNSFGAFRDAQSEPKNTGFNGKKATGLGGEIDDDRLVGDDFNRDAKDMERERTKTVEEVRIEEELAAEISRVKLKRSHSSSSLDGDREKEDTPPSTTYNPFNAPQSTTTADSSNKNAKEPQTPAKKRRGSGDEDVKSPTFPPTRGLNFGSSPIKTMNGFGCSLAPPISMDEEEL